MYKSKEFHDRKLQRHIESSVSELRALSKKGFGGDVAKREQAIFDALEYEMKRNPMNFLMSMLNVLGVGSDFKRGVMRGKNEDTDKTMSNLICAIENIKGE
jgi:hypothetical protein